MSFNRLTGDITVTMPPGTGNIKLSMKPLDDRFGGVENGAYFPESIASDNALEKFTLEIVGVKGNEARANSGLSVDTVILDDGIGSGLLDGPKMGLVALNKNGTVNSNTDTEVRVGENVGHVEFRLFAEGGYSPILAEEMKVLVAIDGTAIRVADISGLDPNDLTGTLDYAFDFSSLPPACYSLVSLGGGREGIVFTFPAGTNVSELTFKAYINLDLVDEAADTLILSIQEIEGSEASIGVHNDVTVKIFDLSVRPYLTQSSDEVQEGGTATYTFNLIHKSFLATGQFDPVNVADMLVLGEILTEATVVTCRLTLGEAVWGDVDWTRFQTDNPQISNIQYDDVQNIVTFTVTIPAGSNQLSIAITPQDDLFGGVRNGASLWGMSENVENDSPFEVFHLEILTISGNEAQLITHTADGDVLTKLETKIVDDGHGGGALDGPQIGVMINTGASLVASADATESDNDATIVNFRLVDVNAVDVAKDFTALETLHVAVQFGGTGKYGPANISAAGETVSGDYILDTATLDAFKAGHAGFDYTFNTATRVLLLTLPKDMKLSDVPIRVQISQDPYTDDGDTVTATVVDVEGNEASIGSGGALVTVKDDDPGMRAILSVDKVAFYESAGVGGDATSHQLTYTISLKDGNNALWNPENRAEDVTVSLKVTLGDTAYGDIDWAKFQTDNSHITDFSHDAGTNTITFKVVLVQTQQVVDFVLTAKEDFFGGARNGASGQGLSENVTNDRAREEFTIAIVGIAGNEARINSGVSSSVDVAIIDDGHNGGALDGPQIGISIIGHGAAHSVTETAGAIQFGLMLDAGYTASVANGKTVEDLSVVLQVGGMATYGMPGSFGVGSGTDYTFDFSALPAGVVAVYNAGKIILTIPAGVSIADVKFAAMLNNDMRTEVIAEAVTLTVVDVEGNEASVAGSDNAVTLTVMDDDPGFRVVLAADKTSMYEGADLGNTTTYTASLIDVAKLGGATSLPSDMSTVLCDASNRSETVLVTLVLTFGTAGKDDIDWVRFKADNGLADTDLTWNGTNSVSFTLSIPVGQQQIGFTITAHDDCLGGSRNGASPYGLVENAGNDSPSEAFTVSITNVIGNEAKLGNSINGQDFSEKVTTIVDDGYNGGELDGPQIGISIVDTGTLVASKSVSESDGDATVVTFRLVNEKSGLAENFVTNETTQITIKFTGTAVYGVMDPDIGEASSGDYRLDFAWLDSLKAAYHPNFDYTYNSVNNVLVLKIPAGVALADIPVKVVVNQDYYTETGGETIIATVIDTEGNEASKGSQVATVTVNDDGHGLQATLSSDRASFYESTGVGGDAASHRVTYTISLKDTLNDVLWDVADRVEDVTVSLKVTLGGTAYGDIDWTKFQMENPHITNFSYNAATSTITFKTTLDESQQTVDFVLTAKEDYFGGTHDASSPYGLVNNTQNDSPNEGFTVAITGVTGNEARVGSGSTASVGTTLIDDGVNGGSLDGPEIGIEIENEGATFTVTENTASVMFGLTVGGNYVTDSGTVTLETLKVVLKVDGNATWGTETAAGSLIKTSLSDYIFDFSTLPAGVAVSIDRTEKTITLTINAGVDLSDIKIKAWINDDEYTEGSGETLGLRVVDVVGNEAQISAGFSAILTIQDNMSGPHLWITCGQSVVEGVGLPFTLHLDRAPIEPLTVSLNIGPTDSALDVDATRNVDYILTQLQASLDARYGVGVVQILAVDTATGEVQMRIPASVWQCMNPISSPNDFSMSFDVKTLTDMILGEPNENIQVTITGAVGSEVRVGDAGFDDKATGTIAEKTLILTISGDTRVYESSPPHQADGTLIGTDIGAGVGGGSGDNSWTIASYHIDLTEKLGGADNSAIPGPVAEGSSLASSFTFDVQLNSGSASFCNNPSSINHLSGSNDFTWAINGTRVTFDMTTPSGRDDFMNALNASGMLPPGVTVISVGDNGRTLTMQVGTDYVHNAADRISLQVASIDDGVQESNESYSIAIKNPSSTGAVDADGSGAVNVAIGDKHTVSTVIVEDVAKGDLDGFSLSISNVSGYETDGFVYLEITARSLGFADSGPPVQAITMRLDYGSGTDTAKPYVNYTPNDTYILQPGGGNWVPIGNGEYLYRQKIGLTDNALSDPNTVFTVKLAGVEGNESRIVDNALGDVGASNAKVTIIADTKDTGQLDGPTFLELSLSSILREPGYPLVDGELRPAYNEYTYSITLSGPASEPVVTWLKLDVVGAQEGVDFTLDKGLFSVAHWQLFVAAVDKNSVPGLTVTEIAAFKTLDGKGYVSIPSGATHLAVINTTQQSGTFNIRINHDNKTETDEALSWTVLDMQGSEIVFNGHVPLVNPIYDDGDGPKATLTADPSQYNGADGHVVSEAAGFAKYILKFSEPVDEPVTLDIKLVYQMTNWADFVTTADQIGNMLSIDVPGASVVYDSIAQVFKVTLPAGTTTANLKLSVVDEDVDDEDKTFLMRIVGSDGRGELSYDTTPVTTVLRDNDTVVWTVQKHHPIPTIGMSGNLADMTFEEGDSPGKMDITDKYSIDITGIRNFDRDINIYLQGSDDTALAGMDYEISGNYVGGGREAYKITLTKAELQQYVQDMFDADPVTWGNYEIKYMTFPAYDPDTSPSWHSYEDGLYIVSKTAFYPEDGGTYNQIMPVSLKIGLDQFAGIKVEIIGNDTIDIEEYKDFTLVVSSVDNAYRAGLEKSKVETGIHDDDYVPSQLKLSWITSTDISVTEKTDAFANYKIKIEQDGGPDTILSRDLVLKISIRSGTATANEDFAASGTMEAVYDSDGVTVIGYEYVRYLTIPKGTDISGGYIESLNVAIADDFLTEGREDFKIIVDVYNSNGMIVTDSGTIKPGSANEIDRTTVVTIDDNAPSRLVRIDKLSTWDVTEGAASEQVNSAAVFSISTPQAVEEDTFVLIKIANANPAAGEAGLQDIGQVIVEGETSVTFDTDDIDNARILTASEFAAWKDLPPGLYVFGAECFLKLAIYEGTSSSRITIRTRDDTFSEGTEAVVLTLHDVAQGEAKIDTSADTSGFNIIEDNGDGLILVIEQPSGAAGLVVEGEEATFHVTLSRKYDGVNDLRGAFLDEDVEVSFLIAENLHLVEPGTKVKVTYYDAGTRIEQDVTIEADGSFSLTLPRTIDTATGIDVTFQLYDNIFWNEDIGFNLSITSVTGGESFSQSAPSVGCTLNQEYANQMRYAVTAGASSNADVEYSVVIGNAATIVDGQTLEHWVSVGAIKVYDADNQLMDVRLENGKLMVDGSYAKGASLSSYVRIELIGAVSFISATKEIIRNGIGTESRLSSHLTVVDDHEDGPRFSVQPVTMLEAEGGEVFFDVKLQLPAGEATSLEGYVATFTLSGAVNLSLPVMLPSGVSAWTLTDNGDGTYALVVRMNSGLADGAAIHLGVVVGDNLFSGSQDLKIELVDVEGSGTDSNRYEKPSVVAGSGTVNIVVTDEAFADQDGPKFSLVANSIQEIEGTSASFNVKVELPTGDVALQEGYDLTLTLSGAGGLSLPGVLPAGVDAWTLTDNHDGTYTLLVRVAPGALHGGELPITLNVADNAFIGQQILTVDITGVQGQGLADGFRYEKPVFDSGTISINIVDEDAAGFDGPSFALADVPTSVSEGTALSFSLALALPLGETMLQESFDVFIDVSGIAGITLPGILPVGISAWSLIGNILTVTVAEGCAAGNIALVLNVPDNYRAGSEALSLGITGIASKALAGEYAYETSTVDTSTKTVDVVDESDASERDGPIFSLAAIDSQIEEGNSLSFSVVLDLPDGDAALQEPFELTFALSDAEGLSLPAALPAGISAWELVAQGDGNWALVVTVAPGAVTGSQIPLTLDVADNLFAGSQILDIVLQQAVGKGEVGDFHYEHGHIGTTDNISVIVTDELSMLDREGPVFSLESSTSTLVEGDVLSFGVKVDLPLGNSALHEGYVLTLLLSNVEGLSLSGALPAGVSAWTLTGEGPYTLSLTLEENIVAGSIIPLTMNVADNVFAGDQSLDIILASAVGQGGSSDFTYERTEIDTTPLSFTLLDDDLSGPQFSLNANGSSAVLDGDVVAFDLNVVLPDGELTCREDFFVSLTLSGMERIEAVGSEYTLVDQGGGFYTLSLTVTAIQAEAGTIPLEIKTPAASAMGDQVLNIELASVVGTGSGENHYESAQWGADGSLEVTVHDSVFHALMQTIADETNLLDTINALASPDTYEGDGLNVHEALGDIGALPSLYSDHEMIMQTQLNQIDVIFSG